MKSCKLEEIFAKHLPDKALLSKIHRKLLKLNNEETT